MIRRLPGLALLFLLPTAADAQVKLLAVGSVPANALDKSGLNEKLAEGTPHNLLGAFGSGIAWTGKGNRYVLVPDRGPSNGDVKFLCRFHVADIRVVGDTVHFDLLDTKLLRNKMGAPFVGSAHALQNRLDPEAIRVSTSGTVYLADEYGPHLLEFDRDGNWIRSFDVPAAFQVSKPSGATSEELRQKQGRVPNRGMESLALSLDGKKLYGCMQSPLMQDGGREGLFCRILEVDIASGKTRQFVYPLESNKTGVSEILAIAPGEFLVLERDGKKGKGRLCKIIRINLAKATDVSAVPTLPKAGLPGAIVPVAKSLFLDMMQLGLSLTPKIEGLAFGPDFSDGRKLLLVTSDNDFIADQPTMIYAFSVSGS